MCVCVCVCQEYIPTVFIPKHSSDALHQDLMLQCERMDLPFLSYLPTEVSKPGPEPEPEPCSDLGLKACSDHTHTHSHSRTRTHTHTHTHTPHARTHTHTHTDLGLKRFFLPAQQCFGALGVERQRTGLKLGSEPSKCTQEC